MAASSEVRQLVLMHLFRRVACGVGGRLRPASATTVTGRLWARMVERRLGLLHWPSAPPSRTVALLIPCFRRTWAVVASASCYRGTAIIRSSVNVDRFIVRTHLGAGP